MKNDLAILDGIKEELAKANHPSFDPAMVEFYRKLAERVPEEGFVLHVNDKEITDAEESALQLLHRLEYVVSHLKYHGREGHIYHVNLRGQRFLDFARHQAIAGMQDSGKREFFASGAVRDAAEGKPRPDLISPFATERLAEWLRLGALKYTERNWEKGIPVSRCLASLHRHLVKFQQGCTDEDHLAAILCNAMFIVHTQEMCKRGVLPESLLDMPKYGQMPGVHRNGNQPLDF